MKDFIRIETIITEMQKSHLLHLQQAAFDFSKEIITYSISENKELLLFETVPQNKSLLNYINEFCFSLTEAKKFEFCLIIMYMLSKNLVILEENFLAANLEMLLSTLIFVSNTKSLEKLLSNKSRTLDEMTASSCLQWFILPQDLNINLSLFTSNQESIWDSFCRLDSAHQNIYSLHQDMLKKGNLKEAMHLLESHLSEYKQKNSQNESNLLAKAKKSNDRSSPKNKLGLFEKIKNFKLDKTLYKEVKTVPLNPQDELFRLAMISEGIPGTEEENEGIRAFILIDEFLIGRDKSICDLHLDEKTIGRVHTRISRHGSHYFIEDLGSANGTYMDGKKLNKHQTYLMPDHCRLKFAELAFYFTID